MPLHLTVLLPCHSLDDFPSYFEGKRADATLAAWCVPWHPALLVAADEAPAWDRADAPSQGLADRLLCLPAFCLDRLPDGFAERASAESAGLIEVDDLASGTSAALSQLGMADTALATDLVADFHALGFCRLQVEVLTRLMQRKFAIDEAAFAEFALAAAHAALGGDRITVRKNIALCLNMLFAVRKQFYDVEISLLDITLLAPTTLGTSLAEELAGDVPGNVLAPTELLTQLSTQEPATWNALQSALKRGAAHVLGNGQGELALPLLPLEQVRASLLAGAQEYQQHVGRRPQVYARRKAGLWPALPQILLKLGYQGVLHATLDDGRFPLSTQAKSRWVGLDGGSIDMLSRLPNDAGGPDAFISLARKLNETIENDHVATIPFAHWPGKISPWYALLKRIASHSDVLGKFVSLENYFINSEMPESTVRFEADRYRTPYLRQEVTERKADPVSRFVQSHRQQGESDSMAALNTLSDLIGAPVTAPCDTVSAALARFDSKLPRTAGSNTNGILVANTLSFARTLGIEISPEKYARVEVPAMGFTWVDPTQVATPKGKPIARENVLANEFFELQIGRNSGGIQALRSYQQRGNRLSQQIAVRMPAPEQENLEYWDYSDPEDIYTTMRAESVEITQATPVVGEIVSRGTLLDPEQQCAGKFRQTTRVWAGSRVIQVEIELDELGEFSWTPWHSYCAARFAWPDEDAELFRGVGLTRQPTAANRIEAPEYLQIDNGTSSITLLTGGLPYHARSATRMLDSLLVVRGESSRRFSFGIGIDLPWPAHAAAEWLAPATYLPAVKPANTSGWFFHLDARQVLATHWEPIYTETGGQPGRVAGFRVRLMETSGKASRLALRTFRRVATARQVSFLGETILEARVDGDRVLVDFSPHEWVELEALWA